VVLADPKTVVAQGLAVNRKIDRGLDGLLVRAAGAADRLVKDGKTGQGHGYYGDQKA
jgi:hypothetical protein